MAVKLKLSALAEGPAREDAAAEKLKRQALGRLLQRLVSV
jgi:hypothetical protein